MIVVLSILGCASPPPHRRDPCNDVTSVLNIHRSRALGELLSERPPLRYATSGWRAIPQLDDALVAMELRSIYSERDQTILVCVRTATPFTGECALVHRDSSVNEAEIGICNHTLPLPAPDEGLRMRAPIR